MAVIASLSGLNVAQAKVALDLMIILARLLSGVDGALIIPLTLAVVTSGFPVEERSNVIGIWTGVAGGLGILGMYLSALLVEFTSWRWLFLLPIILGVTSIILALLST